MKTNSRKNKVKKQKIAMVELPITNSDGIACFSDFLVEIQRQYEIEKNIKNNLYAFIMQRGLLKELRAYSTEYDMTKNGHERALTSLIMGLPENTNTGTENIEFLKKENEHLQQIIAGLLSYINEVEKENKRLQDEKIRVFTQN